MMLWYGFVIAVNVFVIGSFAIYAYKTWAERGG